MNVNNLLEKLEPLLPGQTARWKRSLHVADAGMKSVLERHIHWVARKRLGPDFERKILLSLPPEDVAAGQVELGSVSYDKTYWPFGLSHVELTQHVAILGRSGAGKTNIAYHLMRQLSRQNIPWLFLDWKRSARDLMLEPDFEATVSTPGKSIGALSFNPLLVPPKFETAAYVNLIVDQFADAYTLGEGAKSILQGALVDSYAESPTPTIAGVIARIKSTPAKERRTGWKLSALRALQSYSQAIPTNATEKEQSLFAQKLLGGQTILELDGLSHSAKKFLIPLICQWLYTVQLGRSQREKLQFVIFLEEAHHVLYRGEHRSKESLMNRMLRQCRELGIGYVILDQSPKTLSSAALGNCFTSICLNQKHPGDVTTAAELSGVDSAEKGIFSRLPVGQGVVKLQDRWSQPFLVEFPLFPIRKGAMTDELLKLYLSRNLKGISPGTPQNASRNTPEIPSQQSVPAGTRGENSSTTGTSDASFTVDKRRVPPSDTTPFTLLHDCVQFPHDSLRQRYRRLGVGAGRGTRLKNELLTAGLVTSEFQKTGQSTRTVLRPTEAAKQLLTPQGQGKDGRASFEHEYTKQQIAKQLSESGYKTQFEVRRPDAAGRTDVVAARATDSIAIEVETGKSDVVGNVLANLKAGYKEILVVATDESARKRVERQLDRAGLLMPPRVRVVLG